MDKKINESEEAFIERLALNELGFNAKDFADQLSNFKSKHLSQDHMMLLSAAILDLKALAKSIDAQVKQ